MSENKLVSVCINCYNAENTIEQTVRSVLSQTYPHLQVIVVDDGSTDGTADVLASFDDDRLEVYRLVENGHISNANNEALRHVRGAYVAHLDADDIWFPDKIEKQITFLESHPEYGACFSLAEMVDEHNNPVDDHRFRAENRPSKDLFRHLVKVGNYLCHSSMFARKDVMDRVGEHDVTLLYFHDFDYWIRMSLQCEIYIFPEKMLFYRISTGSNSYMKQEKKNVHVFEFARIAYRSIVECPDAFFLEAFSDLLRRPDLLHDHEQTELEKAFVLMDMIAYHRQNPALGLRRLCELFADKRYVETARRDFGFTVKDLYRLEETAVYHDEEAFVAAHATIADLSEQVNSERQQIAQYQSQICGLEEQLRVLHAENDCAQREYAALQERYREAVAARDGATDKIMLMENSISWKVTSPLRSAKAALKAASSGISNKHDE